MSIALIGRIRVVPDRTDSVNDPQIATRGSAAGENSPPLLRNDPATIPKYCPGVLERFLDLPIVHAVTHVLVTIPVIPVEA